ncbi:MAG: reverse transcriptase domain-containing protein [Thermodesulfobacteriota bacterium]|nr:reverse transcriptase domain-containing protein [Thermodesulfobacteriota bacterium]
MLQGGPLSPLANILLDDLDVELEKRGHRLPVRYEDDFIIMVKSLFSGQRVIDSIRRFLKRELRLTVNEQKSR